MTLTDILNQDYRGKYCTFEVPNNTWNPEVRQGRVLNADGNKLIICDVMTLETFTVSPNLCRNVKSDMPL